MSATKSANEPTGPVPEAAFTIHDFRNPLSTIHLGAEMLLSAALPAPLHRVARNMYGASVRLKELCDESLSRDAKSGMQQRACNLRELISSAVERIAVLAESQSVELIQRVSGNVVVTLDFQRIRRVLINLFVNALEAMPKGGTIHISALAEADSALIKVRDTGPGIAPELRERLFEPFATAGKAGGLGLGLSLSRQAVLDHGGQMWVEFGGQGACFAMLLPVAPGAEPVHADALS
ncbi:MAG TPA: HAMP domain-containing sensor histidine kinase [Bryobacteraceae bacterium]|nr:HAMP domain-containing sensor histidine kinase [Bryobacteraceae bacterium]